MGSEIPLRIPIYPMPCSYIPVTTSNSYVKHSRHKGSAVCTTVMKFPGRHRQKLNAVFQDPIFKGRRPEKQRELPGIKEARRRVGILSNCKKLFLWRGELGQALSQRLYLASWWCKNRKQSLWTLASPEQP